MAMGETELRHALAALAAEDLPGVLAEARADARERARAKLADALEAALLEAVVADAEPEAGDGCYVFGVVRAGSIAAPAATELVDEGGLSAVVRRVPLAEFGEEALRANLNDIAWLEDAARRHEAVLEGLLQEATVIPLRLCTIYHDEGAVRAMLASEQAALGDALDRLEGHTEWGVKAFCDHAAVQAGAQPAGGEGQGEGEAYLARRRAEARARELVTVSVEAAHERLSAIALVALANPLQRKELTGRSDDMALNGVYLVADARARDLRAEVERLGADGPPGLTFELTGPWPPYNFVPGGDAAALA
jgi:Gas vesicle synthesis protein GvpL/GvpF